MSIKETTHL